MYFLTFFRFEAWHTLLTSKGDSMKYVVTNEQTEASLNSRDTAPSAAIDMSVVADLLFDYREKSLQTNPYTHSSFPLRLATLMEWCTQRRSEALDAEMQLAHDLSLAIIIASLERQTNIDSMAPTPHDAVLEVFNDEFIETLRIHLSALPLYVDPTENDVAVVDLAGVQRFVMKMCPHLWMSQEEEDAAHERRLFGGDEIQFEYINLADIEVGEEDNLSDLDEWADETDFPWDNR